MKWISLLVLIFLGVGFTAPSVRIAPPGVGFTPPDAGLTTPGGRTAAPNTRGPRIFYVDAGATGANDGSSWFNAYTDLQNALQVAQYGEEIWVAEGVYRPVVPANPPNVTDVERETSFLLSNGVALYGGFAGNEVSRTERDFEAHTTTLSGDLLGNDNDSVDLTDPTRSDNTWRVFVMGDENLGPVDNTTVLDGVRITGGNADPPPLHRANSGGGLFVIGALNSNPIVQNVRLEANSAIFGGGAGCVLASPTLRNVDFINNFALKDGGGMSAEFCGAAFKDVLFQNNTAGSFGGGLINNRGASTLVGVSFIGNRAERGGGVYNLLDNSLFIGTFYASNEAIVSGGGMYNDESATEIMNAVFTGNRTLDPSPDAARRGGGGMGNFSGKQIDNIKVPPYLTNVVFYGNASAGDGGAIFNINSDPLIFNSILWGDHADDEDNEMFSGGRLGSSPIVAANIIEGGLPPNALDGGGILDKDPFFTDPDGMDDIAGTLDDDLRLLPGSPAIDVGINQALLFDVLDLDEDGDTFEAVPMDFDGNYRVHNGNGGVFAVDMGAYEFGAPPVIVAIETDIAELPVAPVFLDAYPNPFRDQATFRFALPTSDRVVLTVYDMLGREVATMIDNDLPAGTHEANFYAPDLASGLYLFHLDIAGNSVTKKMMLVK